MFFSAKLNIETKKDLRPTIPVPTPHIFNERELWGLIQEWRLKNNFPVFVESPRLCSIATDRVDDEKFDNHKGFWEKYGNLEYIGENIGGDYFSEKELLLSWLNSPSHRTNLERNYTHSCLRCEDKYCVQIFGYF